MEVLSIEITAHHQLIEDRLPGGSHLEQTSHVLTSRESEPLPPRAGNPRVDVCALSAEVVIFLWTVCFGDLSKGLG